MARDAESTSPTRIEVSPSLTAELIFAANAAASVSGARWGLESGWVERQRALLPRDARASLSRFAGFWWPTMGLIDFLCWNGQFDDTEAFLRDVAATPIDAFLSILFNGDLTPQEAAALLQAPATARTLGDRLSPFSRAEPAELEALFRDPEEHRQVLLALVRASDTPLFRESFQALSLEAAPTVATLERRLATEDPVAVAESLRGKALKGPREYKRANFIPSRLMGHRNIQCWGNQNAVFLHQVGNVPLTGPTATGADLANFLKVLSDPTRVDILRLLSCRASFGKEIASDLGLTTATVSRHLDQLKAAGLVSEARADANNVKLLRYVPESLELELERLRAYLLHS